MAKKGKTRRKPRSAAQKRASKKNIKKAQSSRRRNKPKSKRKSKKSNKPRKNTKKKMAKRPAKSKKSFIDKIPILKNPTVQRVGFGLGMGVVVVKAIDLIAQVAPPALAAPLVQNKRIIQLGVEAVTEPISAIVDVATGGGFNLQSLTGRGQQQQNAVQSIGNGFA